MIEIFSTTDALVPETSLADERNWVPERYRFLEDDLVASKDYTIQFEARTTVWQYVVVRKYSEDLDLEDLDIVGDIDFTRQVDTDSATFTSDQEVVFSETRQDLNLVKFPAVGSPDLDEGSPPDAFAAASLCALPNPQMKHVLQKDSDSLPGAYLSRMYINV